MSSYAIIENGKVVNTVVAEPDYARQQGWVEIVDKAGIGWDYDGAHFIDNRPVPEVVAPPIAPPAPSREALLVQLRALQQQIEALT
ncbi:hypothetical protein EBQ81_01625 [bacterium]|nr:hypothetical protein [bacterium]